MRVGFYFLQYRIKLVTMALEAKHNAAKIDNSKFSCISCNIQQVHTIVVHISSRTLCDLFPAPPTPPTKTKRRRRRRSVALLPSSSLPFRKGKGCPIFFFPFLLFGCERSGSCQQRKRKEGGALFLVVVGGGGRERCRLPRGRFLFHLLFGVSL